MTFNSTNYYFVPSLRQGLAAAIAEKDNNENPIVFLKRAAMKVNAELGGTGFSSIETIKKNIELYGPGDIVGFDRKIIARTDPQEDVGDFEPNYFPMIEFVDADFLWRYTPKQLNSETGNLSPWISLVVLIAEPLSTPEGQIEKEFEEGNRLLTGQHPFIKVYSQSSLPNSEESKWWSHVQLSGDDSLLTDGELRYIVHEKLLDELNRIVLSNPERVNSHLLCPRRLRAGMKYCAFVVPTFELGRIATGLKTRPLSDGETLKSITPAWNSESSDPIDLPYYYKWEFRTGLRGDFEHLVRLLEPRELNGLGKCKIDCSNPGYGLTNFNRQPEELNEEDPDFRVTEREGALKSFDTTYTPWGKDFSNPADDPHEFQTALADHLLNKPKADEETPSDPNHPPVVGPPVYGRWHRGRKPENNQYVRPGPEHTGWLDELNLDPRHRAVSGLGTEVIKKQQEELMAAAWDQLGAIDEANEQLRRAQLGRELCCKTENRLKSLSQADYIRTTVTLTKRIKDLETGNTLAKKFKNSAIPQAVLDPAFRRIARKRGAIRKRQRSDDRLRPDILHRFNKGTIHPAGPHPTPGGIVDICEITNKLVENICFFNEPPVILSNPPQLLPPGDYAYTVEAIAHERDQTVSLEIGAGTTLPHEGINIEKINANLWNITIPVPDVPSSGTGTGGDTGIPGGGVVDPPGGGPGLPGFHAFFITISAKDNGTPPRTCKQTIVGEARDGDSQWRVRTTYQTPDAVFLDFPNERRFCTTNITSELLSDPKILSDLSKEDRTILALVNEMMEGFLSSDDPSEPKPGVDLNTIQQRLREALDPEVTLPRRVLRRIGMQDILRKGDLLDRIMAAPDFPQPMYEALNEISPNILLPGMEKVPQNTVSLLKPNSRFIESYMVGLNHEFSRELLWREYPTDQRGSYFRQFWDVNEVVPTQGDLQELLNSYLSDFDVDFVEELPLGEKKKILNRYRKRVGKYEDLSELERDQLLKELLEEELFEEKNKDITKLHNWYENPLGENKNRPKAEMVLLIRGDLLKRYPNTVIYAVEAFQNADGVLKPNLPEYSGEDSGTIMHPIFKGNLPPDVYFIGFAMEEQEARGDEGLGWYFVLEERISESRFGMDVPSGAPLNSWDDLAWDHFKLGESYGAYASISSNDISNKEGRIERMNAESSSSFISSKVVQKPVRICIHANQMLQ